MKQTKLSDRACTNCGRKIDGASAFDGSDKWPVPGSISVCMYCGHLMAFADDLSMRDLNDNEIVATAGDKTILAIQRARAAIKPVEEIPHDEKAEYDELYFKVGAICDGHTRVVVMNVMTTMLEELLSDAKSLSMSLELVRTLSVAMQKSLRSRWEDRMRGGSDD